MSKNLEIQELAIVVTANNYDPNLLSPNFLKLSGIIDEDWELARKPIVSERASQVVFNNGIYLAAQPNRFSFVEALNDKEEDKVFVPKLVSKYLEILRNIDCQRIGINFRGYVSCNGTTIESNNYLGEHFIVPGEWQNCGTKPVKAGLNLMFTYEEKQLYLSVNEAGLKFPEKEQLPIVLFGGNFDYSLESYSLEQKLDRLQSITKDWHQDLQLYSEVVEKMVRQSQDSKQKRAEETVAV